jgi:hypothetical protein
MKWIIILTITILILSITIIFSRKLYQTYKTHKTTTISYPILISMLIFSIGVLLALLQKSYQKEILELLKLETINCPLLITMYFIVGTLYIIYIKKIYEEADSIENKLTEKGIININIDNQSTEEPPIKESKNK